MARGLRAEEDDSPAKDRQRFCAEHAGEIASFDTLRIRLTDLAEYGDLFRRETTNFAKVEKIAMSVVAATVVAAPVAVIAGPGLAAAIGKAGMLGSTASGTSIATLSGSTLTKASLAAIGGGALSAGGGGMALGSVIVMATGSALGGVQGAVVSNAYFGDVKDFAIRYLCSKSQDSPSLVKHFLRHLLRIFRPGFSDCDNLVFVNGFLQQHDHHFDAWLRGVQRHFPRARKYGVLWESKSLKKLGKDLLSVKGIAGAGKKLPKYMLSLGKKPGAVGTIISALLANPWHTTMLRSGMVGAINADLLCRIDQQRTSLMGHSLGARTIYYTLQNLSQRPKSAKPVLDVFLFGGAVDRTDQEGWARAAAAVEGSIYNFYSTNDSVLKYLYTTASGLVSNPIGIGTINSDAPNVINVDCSDLVANHQDYKPNLEALLVRALVAKASQEF